jgi:hypothetical protein
VDASEHNLLEAGQSDTLDLSKDNVFFGGLTYNTHPVSVAAALATNAATSQPTWAFAIASLTSDHCSASVCAQSPTAINAITIPATRIARTARLRPGFELSTPSGPAEVGTARHASRAGAERRPDARLG